MDSSDQCHFPRCRQAPGVTLGFADNIRLCDKHWEQHCEIDFDGDWTIAKIVKYEKARLKFQSRCGASMSKRALAKMERDLENYTISSCRPNERLGHITIAEWREWLANRDEPAEAGEPFDPERHGPEYCRACELYECECEDESAQEDDEDEEDVDEFGGLGDYL